MSDDNRLGPARAPVNSPDDTSNDWSTPTDARPFFLSAHERLHPSRVIKMALDMSTCFQWAVKEEFIDRNPMVSADLPSNPREHTPSPPLVLADALCVIAHPRSRVVGVLGWEVLPGRVDDVVSQPHGEKGFGNAEPALLTIAEVADLLRCSVKTIRRRVLRGDLAAVRLLDSGPWLFPRDEVLRRLTPVLGTVQPSSAGPPRAASTDVDWVAGLTGSPVPKEPHGP